MIIQVEQMSMKFNGFTLTVETPKARKITPAHAVTKIEEDKTKYTRKEKHKSIEICRPGETYGRR